MSDAITPDGRRVRRAIAIGQYKTLPNNVETSTGETYYFTPPEHVPQEMTDLIDWYREQESAGTHPIIIAAAFHYRFVRIHPFDDGKRPHGQAPHEHDSHEIRLHRGRRPAGKERPIHRRNSSGWTEPRN